MSNNSDNPPIWAKVTAVLIVIAAAIFCIHVLIRLPSFIAGIALVLPTLDVAIIVALITGSVSVASVILGSIFKIRLEYSRRKEEFLVEKRIKPYERLVAMVYKVNEQSKDPGAYSEREIQEDISSFSRELTLWGSSKAIQQWGDWRTKAGKASQSSPIETLFAMEEVLFQLRIDMGQGRGLKRGDLLRLFVNDIDEYL